MNNSEIVVRQLLQAINNHDIDRLRFLLHPQYSRTGTEGKRVESPQTGIENVMMYLKAIPDLNLEIKHLTSSGDTVVVEYTPHGTFKGKLKDINPTNHEIDRMIVCEVYEIRENKIYSEREYYNSMAFYKALGVSLKEPAHA